MALDHNVFSIYAGHSLSPPKGLLQSAKWPCSMRCLHLHIPATVNGHPVIVFTPDSFEYFQPAEIIEEAALTLDLHASLSHNGAVLSIHTFGAEDEKRPHEELVHAARDADLRNMVEALSDIILKIRRTGG